MKRVTRLTYAIGAMTSIAALTVVACSSGEALPVTGAPAEGSSAAEIRVTEEAAPLCSEGEALSLLRLRHLRALHLATAMRERLGESPMRAFGDRMVEDHMNLVNEIDAARGSSSSHGRDGGGGWSPAHDRGIEELGGLTDRAVKEIEDAPDEDVERVYVEHQLAEHMRSIGLIDHVLLPAVGGRAQGRGDAYDVVEKGRALFAKHVHHLYEREVALEHLCGPDVEVR